MGHRKCDECGAVLSDNGGTAAAKCPRCGSAVAADGESSSGQVSGPPPLPARPAGPPSLAREDGTREDPPKLWRVALEEGFAGPVDIHELKRMATSGELQREALVCRVGTDAWAQVASIPVMRGLFAASSSGEASPEPTTSGALALAPEDPPASDGEAPQSTGPCVEPDELELEQSPAASRRPWYLRRTNVGWQVAACVAAVGLVAGVYELASGGRVAARLAHVPPAGVFWGSVFAMLLLLRLPAIWGLWREERWGATLLILVLVLRAGLVLAFCAAMLKVGPLALAPQMLANLVLLASGYSVLVRTNTVPAAGLGVCMVVFGVLCGRGMVM